MPAGRGAGGRDRGGHRAGRHPGALPEPQPEGGAQRLRDLRHPRRPAEQPRALLAETRSTDGGLSFQIAYEEAYGVNPPTLETDEANNLYLIFPTENSNGTRFLKFAPGNYSSPAVNKTTTAAGSAGKFASFYDRTRGLLCHATQWGYFLVFDKSGNLTKSKRVWTTGSTGSGPSYPHLFVDEGGVIHYAMTTHDSADAIPYETIRYLKSTNGGDNWKKMNGTSVSIPVSCDPDSSNSTQINLEDEDTLNTWLGHMHVKNGKAHFMYNTRGVTPVRQHYMRFNATTGVREIDSYTDWGNQWGNPPIQSAEGDGLFASDPDDPAGPLFAVGRYAESSTRKRLVGLVSHDNGSTWQNRAITPASGAGDISDGLLTNVGGCRTLTPDGKVIGTLAADRPQWATCYFYQFSHAGDPPVVDSGVGGIVPFPQRSVSLDGTVTDDGGGPLTTTWSMASGPGDVTFGDAGAVDTVAVFPAAGTYILRLTATDGFNPPVSDDLRVTVLAGTPTGEGIGECSAVTVDTPGPGEWHATGFLRGYTTPVVVMGPPGHNDADPATVRVRNVSPAGFEFQLDEWDYLDGRHAAETIGCLVLEAGDHTLADGTRIKAGAAPVDHNFTAVSFPSRFAFAPVVLTQVTSDNDPAAVATRVRNITAAGFEVRLVEEEGNDGSHAAETVHWIAIEQSSGQSGGLVHDAAITFQNVTDGERTIPFNQSFAAPPVFLAALQTFADADPCTLRHTALGTTDTTVFIEEEASADTETAHGRESAGYLAIDPGILGLPDSFADWISRHDLGGLTAFTDDPDGDDLANGLENFLGTNPGAPNAGLTQVTSDGTTTTFTHPQNPSPAADVSAGYEWSTDLGSWHPPGTAGGTTVTITPNENTPTAGTTTVTVTAAGAVPATLFVRLTASQAAGSP